MKIKVYNENGNIRITKTTSNNVEQTMFSNLYNGEVAEINVEVANLSVVAKKDIQGSVKDFLLGKTSAEVYCMFASNYNTSSKQLYYNGIWYQLLFDKGLDNDYIVVDVYAR